MTALVKKASLLLLIFSCAQILQGCLEQENATNTAQRETDRQNAMADQLEGQYSKITGKFAGNYNATKLLLTLDVFRQSSTSNFDQSIAPVPHLGGSLEMTPEVYVDDTKHPLGIPFPITDGQYVSGNDLSLTVSEGATSTQTSTTLHCKVPNLNHLDCKWYVAASTGSEAIFSLDRISDEQESLIASVDSQKLDGTYVGLNKDYSNIRVNFRSVLRPQAGSSSAIPIVTVYANFFFGTNFVSQDGQFDPISSTLAFTIIGDNPIVVNCTVTSPTAIHCTWMGTHGATSYEEFDLTKKSSD